MAAAQSTGSVSGLGEAAERHGSRRPSAAAVEAASSCRRRLQLPLPLPPLLLPAPLACHCCPAPPPHLQRAPKRLRQLESLSGRGLLLGCGTKQQAPAAHFVTLAARCPPAPGAEGGREGAGGSSGGGEWRLVYRSEAVRRDGGTLPAALLKCPLTLPSLPPSLPLPSAAACLQVGSTSNPEWRPLAWAEQQLLQQDPLLDSSTVQLLLALHAIEPPSAAGCGAAAVAAWPDDQQAAGWLAMPVLYAASDRPAFRLPAVAARSSQAGVGSSLAAGAAEADEPAPPEAVGGEQDAAAVAAVPGRQQQQQQEEQQRQQEQQLNGVQDGRAAEQEQREAGARPAEQQQQQPAPAGSILSKAAAMGAADARPEDTTVPAAGAAADASSAAAAGSAADGAALPSADGWAAAATAALTATGACPGRLVAAWQLGSLDELFPAGADLVSLRQPLQPNTLVLSFGGSGLCLYPPPLQLQARAGRCVCGRLCAICTCACCGSACGC